MHLCSDYEAKFQAILDEHEVKFPLPMSQIHYKNVERLKFLKSNGVLFVDIPFHDDQAFLTDVNIHAVKIFDSPDHFSYIPKSSKLSKSLFKRYHRIGQTIITTQVSFLGVNMIE